MERSDRVGLVYLGYANPLTAAVTRRGRERTVAFCRERNIVIAYHIPHVEIAFDGAGAPEGTGAR